ncbi:MAG: hypothetical protein J0H54_05510 [Rhizobiales bacterium]|nr:hypothetical protein [Hyphomicrobiales bacterium]
MKRWSVRQILVLLLAVFVTAGMNLSAAQASEMTVKMVMASDMGVSGHDGCQGCPTGGGDDGMKAMACTSVCVAPVLAVPPQTAPTMIVQLAASYPALAPVLRGQAPAPGHYPPRTADIG